MSKKFNILVGDGQLGSAMIRRLPNVIHLTRRQLDFANTKTFMNQLHESLDNVEIQNIVNTTGYTQVEKAEVVRNVAENINANSVKMLAQYANSRRATLIHYSSSYVFDGKKDGVYSENDKMNPVCHYGRTKALGDNYIMENHDHYLIFRCCWNYSMFAEKNFLKDLIKTAYENKKVFMPIDQIGSIMNTFDVTNATVDILPYLNSSSSSSNVYGIYNLAPQNFASKYDIAVEALRLAGEYVDPLFNDVEVIPVKANEQNKKVILPLNNCLDSNKFINKFNISIRNWDQSLEYGFSAMKRVYGDS